MPAGSFGGAPAPRRRRNGQAALPPPPPPPAAARPLQQAAVQPVQAASTAATQRIQQPFSVQRDQGNQAFNTQMRGALQTDIGRNPVAQAQDDPITQALLANFEADAVKAREQQTQELARLGILKPGTSAGSAADLRGEFEGSITRGRGDILADGVARALAERRNSLQQGLQLSDLTSNQNLNAQALEQSTRQADVASGLAAGTTAANIQAVQDQQRLAEGELLGQLNGQQTEQGRQFDAGQTFAADENAQTRALQRELEGGRLGLSREQLAEQGRQFDAGQGLTREQLAQQQGQFESGQAFVGSQADLDRAQQVALLQSQQGFEGGQNAAQRTLQRELEGGRLGLAERELAEQTRQFDTGLGQSAEQAALDRAQQVALLQSQQGFEGGQNAAQRTLQRELQEGSQGFAGEQAGLDRAQQIALLQSQQGFEGGQNAAERTLERERLAQNQGQFDTSTTEARNAQTRQNTFDLDLAIAQADLQRELEGGRLGLAERELLERGRQFDVGTTETRNAQTRQNQFGLDLAGMQADLERELEGGRLGLSRDQLAEQTRQFDTSTTEARNAQTRQNQFGLDLAGMEAALQRELEGGRLTEQARQFDTSTTETRNAQTRQNQFSLDLAGMQAALQQELEGNRLGEQSRQFDVSRNDQVNQERLARELQANQFNRTLGEDTRRFDVSRNDQVNQERLARELQANQFNQDLALRNNLRGDANAQFTDELALRQAALNQDGSQFDRELATATDQQNFQNQVDALNAALAFQKSGEFDLGAIDTTSALARLLNTTINGTEETPSPPGVEDPVVNQVVKDTLQQQRDEAMRGVPDQVRESVKNQVLDGQRGDLEAAGVRFNEDGPLAFQGERQSSFADSNRDDAATRALIEQQQAQAAQQNQPGLTSSAKPVASAPARTFQTSQGNLQLTGDLNIQPDRINQLLGTGMLQRFGNELVFVNGGQRGATVGRFV